MTDIVSTDWVADHLDELDVVDVRDAWEYDGIGHLPGAVNIPFDSFRAEEHAVESDAGNGDGSDSTGMPRRRGVRSAPERARHRDRRRDRRLRRYARRLRRALPRDGGTTGSRPRQAPPATTATSRHGSGNTRRRARCPTSSPPTTSSIRPLIPSWSTPTRSRAAGDDPESVVVDTREDWEYEEGHVPGAVLLDWKDLVDDESRGILPREEALAVLEARGITPDRRIVLYCNTARRISHTYVVLGHLGFGDLAFYEGSLTEWETRAVRWKLGLRRLLNRVCRREDG